MKKTTVLSIGALFLVTLQSAWAEDHDKKAHWGYSGKTDATHWADLSEANKTCALSKEQSPIDIVDSKVKKAPLPAIEFTYPASSAEIANNGHTVQVSFPAGGSIKVGAQVSNLLQFHFHTPSEEKFNGKAYPLVAHFVHKSAENKLSVVAVLFKEGKENAALKSVFAALPANGKDAKLANIDPAAILPANRAYYGFMGSLTTPPCSDGVRWQVLKEPVEVSKGQIAAFKKLYKMNARPVQPLNDRVIELSE